MFLNRCIAVLMSASLCAAVAGCSQVSPYRRPAVDIPGSWRAYTHAGAQPGEATELGEWWKNFDSEELDSMIAAGLAANFQLRAGIQRVEQARAVLATVKADRYPSISASGDAARLVSNTASSGAEYRSALSAGPFMSYEVDLFGRVDADVQSAEANLVGVEFQEDALALLVVSEIARTYFTLLSQQQRLAIADDNLEISRSVLRIVQARFDVGRESAVALSQQKSKLASDRANREAQARLLANAQHALAVLLGKAPAEFDLAAGDLTALSVPEVLASQPPVLLERRPDIRAAELQLVAANADIGAARAAFFPKVNLRADWSLAAAGLGEPTATAAALAAGLVAPIFQGGRLTAGLKLTEARQLELVESYRQSILVALREVEDALTAVSAARERESNLAEAAAEARRSFQLTRQLYEAGSIDFQTVLDVQRTLLNAEDALAVARLERLLASVDLYKALGGGWCSTAERAVSSDAFSC